MKINQRRSFAFTLVEMIGVLAVIAILVSLLVPQVFRVIDDKKKERSVEVTNTPSQIELVGNRTFIRYTYSFRTVDDDQSIREILLQVDVFERTHPGIEVTSSQLVITGSGKIAGVWINHRPRQTNMVEVTRAPDI